MLVTAVGVSVPTALTRAELERLLDFKIQKLNHMTTKKLTIKQMMC